MTDLGPENQIILPGMPEFVAGLEPEAAPEEEAEENAWDREDFPEVLDALLASNKERLAELAKKYRVGPDPLTLLLNHINILADMLLTEGGRMVLMYRQEKFVEAVLGILETEAPKAEARQALSLGMGGGAPELNREQKRAMARHQRRS